MKEPLALISIPKLIECNSFQTEYHHGSQ